MMIIIPIIELQGSFYIRCSFFSRDKTNLDDLMTKERLNIIFKNSGLADVAASRRTTAFTNGKLYSVSLWNLSLALWRGLKMYSFFTISVTTEALKLLCNLLYNSTIVQKSIGETACLQCIVNRMSIYDETTPHEVKLFDARILFLATALNVPLRNVVKNEMNGDLCLINMLDQLATKFECKESVIKVILQDRNIRDK